MAAKYLGITPRRFRQIHKAYRSTGSIPTIGVNIGTPKKEVPEYWKEIIKEEYETYENRKPSENIKVSSTGNDVSEFIPVSITKIERDYAINS